MVNEKILGTYQTWLDNVKEADLAAELQAMKGDEGKIEDAFYRELEFGTGGLRGVLGAGTNRMNVYTVARAAQGLADYVVKHFPAEARSIAISYDSRIKSDAFAQVSADVFAANGIKAHIYPQLMPTPLLSYAVRALGCAAGVMVTASHNPSKYNGYKVYGADGCQITTEAADAILAEIEKLDSFKDVKRSDFEQGIKDGMIAWIGEDVYTAFIERVKQESMLTAGDTIDKNVAIVYTPLNGAGSIPFRQMLTDRGFTNWYIVEEQENPDPDFTTVGYPNPESPAAFKMSEELGRKVGAELLMATDPDSDRFAIEIRDDKGDYIPLNGNQTGYILVNYILEGRKTAGTLPTNGAMVKSIVTSTLTTDIAESYGVKMYEALTGFKNICGRIPFLHENDLVYLFGYEESVGYAASEDIRDKDGISAGMLVAEAAAYYRLQGKTLWDVLNDIYEKYGYAAEDEPNLILEGIAGSQRISRMMDSLREEPIMEAAGYKVVKTIDYINGYEDIPASNVLRYFLDNGSWFAIRPSGTEPKIKFYFYTIGNSREEALEVNSKIKEDVLARVNRVE